MNITDLIKRVEGATAGSEELDSDIGCYFSEPGGPYDTKPTFLINPRPVSRSLDAALALCERVLPGSGLSINIDNYKSVTIWPPKTISGGSFECTAPTPALALILAMLKALQAKEVGNENV
jgi:hypothetical protein